MSGQVLSSHSVFSHRPEPSGRVVRGGSMDWKVEDDLVNGLFCATLTEAMPNLYRPWPPSDPKHKKMYKQYSAAA